MCSNTVERTIRVVIAADSPIMRAAIRHILNLEAGIEVVGETGDGCEVIELATNLGPDLVLLDIRMRNLDWPNTLQALRQAHEHLRIVMLADDVNRDEYESAMKLGCAGFFLKQKALQLIATCIRKVLAGEIWLEERTLVKVVRRSSSPMDDHPPTAGRAGISVKIGHCGTKYFMGGTPLLSCDGGFH